MFDYLALPA